MPPCKECIIQDVLLNFYCNQLWCNYNASSLRAAHIAFNNVYRRLMNVDYYASMSTLFVNNRLDNFYVIRRKSTYNFLSRLKCSENELLKNITESQYFSVSSFMREYVKILYIWSGYKGVSGIVLSYPFVWIICIFFQ